MKPTKIPVKNMRQLISRSIEGSIVFINIDNLNAYLLEDFNAAVWKLINGKKTINEIVTKLLEEFDASKEKIKEYTIEALNDLKEVGAIHFKK